MRNIVMGILLFGGTYLSGQSPQNNWDFNIDWRVLHNTPDDTVASLELVIQDVWNADSLQAVLLAVSGTENQQVFRGEVQIPSSCFSGSGTSCSISVPSVKSGFYRYEVKLIYQDRSESNLLVKDKTEKDL